MAEGVYYGEHARSDGQEQAQYSGTIGYTAGATDAWCAEGQPMQLPHELDFRGMDTWTCCGGNCSTGPACLDSCYYHIHKLGHRIHQASPWRVVAHLLAIPTGQVIASIEPVHGV